VFVVLNFSLFSIIMENNIIEPNGTFDFSCLSLTHPTGIQGGAYFTKIENNNKPLYIQTSKSVTRQGFVKTGKKYYCDLMFDKNSEGLITWFENLEETCKKLIFEKRDTWFQNKLEEADIETAFNSIIRIYKSGKNYLVRTNIKNNRSDEPTVKIYNENEVSLTINDVTSETNMISILEIQGIKFTSRNFQIDIELKQVMVLDNEPIFNSCLIKNKKNSLSKQNDILQPIINSTADVSLDNPQELIETSLFENTEIAEIAEIAEEQLKHLDSLDDIVTPQVDEINIESDDITDCKLIETVEVTEADCTKKLPINDDSLELDIVNLEIDNIEDDSVLKEIDLDLSLENNNLDTIHLKKPNQVYSELYKAARNKAKQAKKSAIIAYLEAKNIKKTYLLENLDNSDSDFDAEIDEVSESELEGL
jgi:hypothetical protein